MIGNVAHQTGEAEIEMKPLDFDATDLATRMQIMPLKMSFGR